MAVAAAFIFIAISSVSGEENSKEVASSLKDAGEPLMLGAGVSTADTLHTDEVQFSPLGWVMYGVNEDLTIMWDWLLAFGPHPAGFIRYKFLDMDTMPVSMALEVQGVWFSHTQDDLRIEEFAVRHKAWQTYGHLITSVVLSEKVRLHFSGGATYDSYQQYKPYKGKEFEPVTYKKYLYPDAAVLLEMDIRSWLTLNISHAYGNTLQFWDGIPHKQITTMGIWVKPFSKEKSTILSALRIEFSGFYVNVPDPDYEFVFPPIFPVVYWQWAF